MCHTLFPNCVNLSNGLWKLEVPAGVLTPLLPHSAIAIFNIDLFNSDTFLYTTLLIVCGDGTLYA